MNFLKGSLLVLFAALMVISRPSFSAAANVVLVSKVHCKLSVVGEIKLGDYEKLAALAKKTGVQTICLDSGGGSWTEGVKIAEYVMDNFIGTYVEDGAECYSACAIIFLAGARKGRQIITKIIAEIFTKEVFRHPNRTMHVKAKVGFHGPYLMLAKKRYSAQDVQTARVAALQGFSKFLGMMGQKRGVNNTRDYIPKRFIARAIKMKLDELLMVDTVDKAGWLGVRLTGFKQPKRISKRKIFWAIAKLQTWQNDQSVIQLLEQMKRMEKEGHPITYEPPSVFRQRGVTTQGVFTVWLRDGELVPDYYAEIVSSSSGKKYMYLGYHEFGSVAEGPRGYPVEVVSPEDDKRRLTRMGITKRLLRSDHEYLLTPIWYIYSAKTKLLDIAAK